MFIGEHLGPLFQTLNKLFRVRFKMSINVCNVYWEKALTPGNNLMAQQTEQVVYVQSDNCWNPLREAKHQRELLKECFNHVEALAMQ